ncbi:MAG: bactofilin family protein [Eubacteriales bacterium]
MFKRKIIALHAAALAALYLAAPAGAVEIRNGDMVRVEGKLQGPLFAAGNNIVIDADVDGDVFAAGQVITINGSVNGDILAAAQSVRINSSVSGDVRCAAASAEITGTVGQSLTAAARELRQSDTSTVHRDVLGFAEDITLYGAVGRQVLGSGGTIRLNGPAGDVRIWNVRELRVGPAANITGNLTYGSPGQASVSPQAKIAGKVNWEQIQVDRTLKKEARGFNWLALVAGFAAGVLVWGVFALLFPRVWPNLSQNMLKSPLAALGWGVLVLLVAPLASLILLITVIGIPLSLAIITAYAALLYAGKIIAGDAAGRYLALRFGWNRRAHDIFPFMLGFAVLILLAKIPVIGVFINIIAASTATGTVILAIYRWRQAPPAPPAT